jgi:pyruvate formate lyase activating enzyme
MIKGFRGTSLVDFPGKVSAVIYTFGCNYRCPFCYNVELVLPELYEELPDIPEEKVLSELAERKGFIQGVVITGGEPTLWGKRLHYLLERIRHEIDLAIKLDSNGSNPELIGRLLEEGLLDYVALDLKTAPSRYSELGGDFLKLKETLRILREYAEKTEIRITLYPPLIAEEDLEEMLPYLEGFQNIALQKYLPEKNLSGSGVSPYSEREYANFYTRLKEKLPSAKIIPRF